MLSPTAVAVDSSAQSGTSVLVDFSRQYGYWRSETPAEQYRRTSNEWADAALRHGVNGADRMAETAAMIADALAMLSGVVGAVDAFAGFPIFAQTFSPLPFSETGRTEP